jgi:hypothetical protein
MWGLVHWKRDRQDQFSDGAKNENGSRCSVAHEEVLRMVVDKDQAVDTGRIPGSVVFQETVDSATKKRSFEKLDACYSDSRSDSRSIVVQDGIAEEDCDSGSMHAEEFRPKVPSPFEETGWHVQVRSGSVSLGSSKPIGDSVNRRYSVESIEASGKLPDRTVVPLAGLAVIPVFGFCSRIIQHEDNFVVETSGGDDELPCIELEWQLFELLLLLHEEFEDAAICVRPLIGSGGQRRNSSIVVIGRVDNLLGGKANVRVLDVVEQVLLDEGIAIEKTQGNPGR